MMDVEQVTRALVEPLGYRPDTDWDRRWIGNNVGDDSSLADFCRTLAQAALDALRPVPGEPCPCCAMVTVPMLGTTGKRDDLLTRLRARVGDEAMSNESASLRNLDGEEAAAEIERLRAELGR